jgi:hypothetical protein
MASAGSAEDGSQVTLIGVVRCEHRGEDGDEHEKNQEGRSEHRRDA